MLLTALTTRADGDAATHKEFFKTHCLKCHGPDKQKGDVRLDRFEAIDPELWLRVSEQLSLREMPPEDEPQPSDPARAAFTALALSKAAKDKPTRASGLRRLNKREYSNTLRDLLGLRNGTFDPAEYVYDDEIDHGFDTEAEQLVISNELLIEYMAAARKSLQYALFSPGATKPSPQTIQVPLHRVTGTSSRYINTAKNYAIGRSGGKAKLFDGSPSRVPAYPGRYQLTVTASAVDRKFYPIPFTPEQGPILMGFGVMQEVSDSLSAQGTLHRTFELKDDKAQTFRFNSWIDRNHFPYLTFKNGSSKPITQIRSNIRRKNLPPSALKQPYRGPGIKITRFTIEGPFYDEWPPPSFRATYDAETVPDLSQATEREQLIMRFAKRAFRRPVTQAEIRPYLDFLEKEHRARHDWHEALIETLSAILSSIDFLYIHDAGNAATLSAHGLANRLSYFLWSSMPDAQLMALADSGELLKPAVLQKQVQRLLADPRAIEFSRSFADQWLALDTLGTMPPDVKNPQYRSYFRNNLEAAMKEETRAFFHHVLRENRSIADFIDSDYSFLNKSLAQLYDIPFAGGAQLVRTPFPPNTPRGGLLGHGSILTLTSNGVETSPVVRGHWVLAEMLGTPPPPAPKEVPALVPDLNGATTVREQLAKHRTNAACVECHRKMDPIGMSLEAYDPIGRLRVRYENKQPVTTYGTFKGTDIEGVQDLKRILLQDLRPFAYNLTVRLAEYAKGRQLDAADFVVVNKIVDQAADHRHPLRHLVEAIATGDLLRQR
ncbi:MAG: DUF1592 domain-containing protein [Verrucomicrobia subdivision 3 bacterium]|nr:DUF1592 domain-containing protein [Limisphaerales bacterium]